MRIVFMGTPGFAVPCLARLLDDGHEVAGVFTQPDKPRGRGYKLMPPPVKELALERGLPVYQPAKMRDGEALSILRELSPELVVVVAYGKILPKEILELPKYGCVNVHGSLLPRWRGAAPIQWSVIAGDAEGGVTTMYMAEGLDTGDMILRRATPIGPDETSDELYERLAALGAQALSETVTLIAAGRAPREPQDDAASCYAPMLSKELAEIDQSPLGVHNPCAA
ncbi:MAG: methionyl-tRNA formyltransferase [Anaerotruncus massiliensis (ex Togo et al. 2019)]